MGCVVEILATGGFELGLAGCATDLPLRCPNSLLLKGEGKGSRPLLGWSCYCYCLAYPASAPGIPLRSLLSFLRGVYEPPASCFAQRVPLLLRKRGRERVF